MLQFFKNNFNNFEKKNFLELGAFSDKPVTFFYIT